MASNMSDYCESLQPKSEEENFNPLRLNIESLIPLSYGIPTCFVSITVIYILLCKKGRKEFQGSFYTCFAFACFIDLITWITVLVTKELPAAPIMDPLFSLIPETGIIATWAYASEIYFMIAGFINSVVLSLNRFTGIVFFLDDKKIWSRLSKLIIASYLIFPILFTWQVFSFQQPIQKCRIQNFNSTDAYHSFERLPPSYFVHIPNVLAFEIFLCGFLNVTLNIAIIFSLIKRKREDSSKPIHQRRHIPELKLFLIALMGCFNILFEVAFFVLHSYRLVNVADLVSKLPLKANLDDTYAFHNHFEIWYYKNMLPGANFTICDQAEDSSCSSSTSLAQSLSADYHNTYFNVSINTWFGTGCV